MTQQGGLEQVVKKEATIMGALVDHLEKAFKIGGPTIAAPLAYFGYKGAQAIAPDVVPFGESEGLVAMSTIGAANAASLAWSYGDDLLKIPYNAIKRFITRSIDKMPPIVNDVLDGIVSIGCYAGLGYALDIYNNGETNWKETLPMIGFFILNPLVRSFHSLPDRVRNIGSKIWGSYKSGGSGLMGFAKGVGKAGFSVVGEGLKFSIYKGPLSLVRDSTKNFVLGLAVPIGLPVAAFLGYDAINFYDGISFEATGGYVKELFTKGPYSPGIATWASACWLTSGSIGVLFPEYDSNKPAYKQIRASVRKMVGFEDSLATASIGMAAFLGGIHLAHIASEVIPAAQVASEGVAQVPEISEQGLIEKLGGVYDVIVNPGEAAEQAILDGAVGEAEQKYGGGDNTVRSAVIGAARYGPLLFATYTLALHDHMKFYGKELARKHINSWLGNSNEESGESNQEAPAQQAPAAQGQLGQAQPTNEGPRQIYSAADLEDFSGLGGYVAPKPKDSTSAPAQGVRKKPPTSQQPQPTEQQRPEPARQIYGKGELKDFKF